MRISTRQGAPSAFETTGATTPPSSSEMASVSRTCHAIADARRRSRHSATARSASAVRIGDSPRTVPMAMRTAPPGTPSA